MAKSDYIWKVEEIARLLLTMLLYTIKVPTQRYECTFELHRS